jgi:hypothetical protein
MRVLLLVCSSACGRDSPTVASCLNGRERPHALFGRLKAEKVGSLPPVLVVRQPLILGLRFRHRVLFQRSARQKGEGLGTGGCEV